MQQYAMLCHGVLRYAAICYQATLRLRLLLVSYFEVHVSHDIIQGNPLSNTTCLMHVCNNIRTYDNNVATYGDP